MMRSVALVCCSGITLVLHGCGSGGDVKSSCMASQFNLVSQSMDGVVTSTMKQGTDQPLIGGGNFKLKFDVDQFVARLEMDLVVEEPVVASVTTMIVDFDESDALRLVSFSNATVHIGNETRALTNCSYMIAPAPFTKALLVQAWAAAFPQLQSKVQCSGNDGTYDTWNVSDQTAISGYTTSAIVGAQMSKDSLLHSFTEKVLISDAEMNVEIDVAFDVSSAVPGGPTADELSMTQFGIPCTEAPFPELLGYKFVAMHILQQQLLMTDLVVDGVPQPSSVVA